MNNVLIITNKEDITVDFVISRLIELGVNYFRFNTEEIGSELSIKIHSVNFGISIYDNIKNKEINLSYFDSVYYRRPKLPIIPINTSPGEALFLSQEITVILEYVNLSLANKKWLNTVSDLKRAENKLNQLRIAKEIGFNIPESLVTNIPEIAQKFISDQISAIIKPLKVGLIEEPNANSKIVYTNEINDKFIANIDRVSVFPVYIQRKVEKAFDIRVTIVAEEIFAVSIDSQSNEYSRTDWRAAKEILPHQSIDLPEKIQKFCFSIMKYYNLNFAAIDLVLSNDGEYYFLEINPNGQWAWIEQLTNYPISQSIANFLVINKNER
ncbi:MvdC/MvdD family ATP grasp protein [Leptospira licerasiae]|uniref:RimK-like ATP-grasp domain protein n=1 Tax=Leptospira licerasiae str. MMD4847 TaxID=1049971 RepID=A0ABN0H9L0_9LEPT|nr:hypothetical protein [Leptospira licerasiae]EIE01432.1 RimK-like ATP-grasp domain protein [Leptospira licerasiae serovar Varillal str. VAR 010]EJZ42316.1 RimK-like ATP-grasp domain protein [Leptospira licerasiae str. MMD4847]